MAKFRENTKYFAKKWPKITILWKFVAKVWSNIDQKNPWLYRKVEYGRKYETVDFIDAACL